MNKYAIIIPETGCNKIKRSFRRPRQRRLRTGIDAFGGIIGRKHASLISADKADGPWQLASGGPLTF